MRGFAFLSISLLVMGCTKSDAPPAADTTMAVTAAPEPAAPAPISASNVTGKWNVSVMGEQGDSVLTSYVLDATADSSKWTLTFPKGKAIPMKITNVSGDSIVAVAGPFPSQLRTGMTVNTTTTIRLQDGSMVGTTVAHYVTSKSDSVANLRLKGTKAQ